MLEEVCVWPIALTSTLFTFNETKLPLGPLILPVNVAPLRLALVAKLFVTVVAKLGSPLRAFANSFNVSNALGAELMRLLISVLTNAVLAI
jgi:hypothetical protein